LPQRISSRRGAWALALPTVLDEREIALDEAVADHHGDLGLVVPCQRPEGLFEICRAHVVGRRVDQVTGEIDAGELALDVGGIGVLGNHQRRFDRFFRTVAAEAIGAKAIAEEQTIGGERCRLDVPLACRQAAGELAGQERVLRRIGAHAEERASEMTVAGRDQQQGTRLGLETGFARPVERDRIDRPGFDMGGGNGEHWKRMATLGAEWGRSFDVLIWGHGLPSGENQLG